MKILKLSSKNQKEIIKEVEKAIKQGKVVVCPTDTVYGLIADATNKKAVEKIFEIKKRKDKKPIPIFVRDIKMAKSLAFIDKKQEEFLKSVWFIRPNFPKDFQKREQLVKIVPKIWAGKRKVTAVLKLKIKKEKLKIYGIDRKTIALRIPKYKLILDLLKKINKPLTGTSANISGRLASTKIKEVLNQFKNQKYQPDLVINAGNLPKSKPSTVIDLTTSPPKILRP
ncbi:MAG: L-threonylcarbamoyladenylate synthase [Patescibacteria group bacterium]|nr:L-threonylcarbamoyladenylate synthase [Patescibacteria group bacterium]